MTTGICDGCGRLKRLDQAGKVVRHYFAIPVSRRAVPTVGAARVRRLCPGAGQVPRRPVDRPRPVIRQ